MHEGDSNMNGSSTNRDNPTFANDTDTPETPSIETSPGILPQEPIAREAPSRKQANREKPSHGKGETTAL
jgi:hypothetical protein